MLRIQDRFHRLIASAACLAVSVSFGAQAANVDVMTIGDSLTYGFLPGGGSDGGWRVPLNDGLNSNLLLGGTTYNFIGTKGDGNPNTVFNEEGVDSFDGVGGNTALHEGYGGWVINDSNRSAQHIIDHPTRHAIGDYLTTNGGAIAPQNADVVMLMVGINDVLGLTYGGTPHATVDPMVATLGALINDITALAPDATLLVSTLLPVRDGATINGEATATVNARIDSFNEQLLEDFFADTWFSDSQSSGADVYAKHSSHSNVFLLDANSAIDAAFATGDFVSGSNDDVHLSASGYGNLADWYEDRFVGLNIVPTPSSAVVLAVMGGLAMCRRRRAAA